MTDSHPSGLAGCQVLPPIARHEPSPKPDSMPSRRGERRSDRFSVLNHFVDFSLGSLKRAEIVVWMILFRDTKNGVARTSQADIARRAGTSDRTVRTALGRLESLGLLEIVRRGGFRKGVSSYRVLPVIRPEIQPEEAVSGSNRFTTGKNDAVPAEV